MEKKKVCFVGVGSIAKRHIKNLRQIGAEGDLALELHALRRSGEPVEGIDAVYTSAEDMPSDYDAVFITNPTEYHLSALRQFHEKGKHFFIEKPVVSLGQLRQAEDFRLREDALYYVACPLRYNAVIRWVREHVDPREVISVRSISSSYLPDWRPGQDYRATYSARRALGGGVSIDLIHEWDYLTYLFGRPERVCGMIGKKSDLEIDSDDYAIYIAEYADKIAELHLDYFGRKTIREIQLFTREDTVVGDIANHTVRLLRSGEQIDFHEERDDFQKRELRHFLDMVDGKAPAEDGYRHALEVLKLTQGELAEE